MKSPLKYPGGKEKELPIIRENIPRYTGRYIEPFVGGGSVYFDILNKDCIINDKSTDLIRLYNSIKSQDMSFIDNLERIYNDFRQIDNFIDKNKNLIIDYYHNRVSNIKIIVNFVRQDIFDKEMKKSLISKKKRTIKFDNIFDEDILKNMESAIKSAYYNCIREIYNKTKDVSCFYFLREYCYSSMFRYNSKGEFNVPYGGISYNRKDFQKKINYIQSEEMIKKLSTTNIYNLDFEDFFKEIKPKEEDFIFLDPPYDTNFSTYDKNTFDKKDQERLANTLKTINSKFMIVIKNTDFIYNLYKDYNILTFDKTYLVSFKNRNDKEVEHLLIKNY